MVVEKNIVYGINDPEKQILDLFLPDKEPEELIVYFHGGGLEAGDKSEVRTDILVKKGKAVISANYRMYPTAVYPDFIKDAALAVKWALDHLPSTVKRVFVGGSSAGAYLTAMLAYNPEYLGEYGIKTTDITGYIIDSSQMTTHYRVLGARNINPSRIIVDEAAPVYHIHEKTIFPNVFIIISENDMPCRPEQNRMFRKTLEVFGCPAEKVRWQEMKGFSHCEYCGLDEFQDMINDYVDSFR